MKKFSQMADHKTADMCVVIVLSHGREGVASSKDGEYSVAKIIERFDSQNCQALIGKPKLFIFQACRGVERDVGVMVQTDASQSNPSVAMAAPVRRPVRLNDDMLISYSTIPGYVSYRCTQSGACHNCKYPREGQHGQKR